MALGVALALPSTSATAANGGAAPVAVAKGSGGGAAPGQVAGDRDAAGDSGRRAGARATGGATPTQHPRRTPRRRAKPDRGGATPSTQAPAPAVSTVAGIFPVAGAYELGGEDGRFGVGRPGHLHQGQDVAAASGTPIVAPVAGSVAWKANQPGGAGIYLVVRADADGRDYVFMHLKRGSVRVAPGDAVAAGQQLAQVGSTGRSTGPHLHFEIWIGGWQARGGAPVDPLPQLRRWAAG
jgi:murein DD-endopeptidase MepM/ murein hydrolase activator NlpD